MEKDPGRPRSGTMKGCITCISAHPRMDFSWQGRKILAPAGGVPGGWQTVLRAKNIYGPYETRIVLHQGNTGINGPHQGGLVELESGEWWFIHFQERGVYGRIVHLQPVRWENGRPVMGVDANEDGIGEPVAEFKKPDVGRQYPAEMPQTTDEFNGGDLGLQWQWQTNPREDWYSLKDSPGKLRLYSVQNITQNGNFWFVPNLLLQKFPMPEFKAETCIEFKGRLPGEHCGLVVMGDEWAFLSLTAAGETKRVGIYQGSFQQCENQTLLLEQAGVPPGKCYLRVRVNENGICRFGYSTDNKSWQVLGKEFRASKGRWIGAKLGLFCINPNLEEGKAFDDVDWFRVLEWR
jgi:beta-xylosidase